MIRFSVSETPHNHLLDYKRSLRDAEGRVVPMALHGYATAATEAGVDPQATPDDVTFDDATRSYVFTFKDADTYPALYPRATTRMLAIGLNPKGYGPLHLMNDFPLWRPEQFGVDEEKRRGLASIRGAR